MCPESTVQCVWYDEGPLGILLSQTIPWAPVIVEQDAPLDEAGVSPARHQLWWRDCDGTPNHQLRELVGREVISVGGALTEACTLEEVEAMVQACPRPTVMGFGEVVTKPKAGRTVRATPL